RNIRLRKGLSVPEWEYTPQKRTIRPRMGIYASGKDYPPRKRNRCRGKRLYAIELGFTRRNRACGQRSVSSASKYGIRPLQAILLLGMSIVFSFKPVERSGQAAS